MFYWWIHFTRPFWPPPIFNLANLGYAHATTANVKDKIRGFCDVYLYSLELYSSKSTSSKYISGRQEYKMARTIRIHR